MTTYFFSAFLPTISSFQEKYAGLVVKYPDINKYLYVSSLQMVLHEIPKNQQKELMVALESSESLAEKWILAKPELVLTLTEHLERSILSVSSKLL